MARSVEEQEFYDVVWDYWTPPKANGPFCIVCLGRAVTLHEIIPRSTYPDWILDWKNSVPICADCHDDAHRMGTDGREFLAELRDGRLGALELWFVENRPDPGTILRNKKSKNANSNS